MVVAAGIDVPCDAFIEGICRLDGVGGDGVENTAECAGLRSECLSSPCRGQIVRGEAVGRG